MTARRNVLAGAAATALALAATSSLAIASPADGTAGKWPPRLKSAVSAKDFKRATFSRPIVINNRWSPLRPGMRFAYKGFANDGKVRTPRKIVYTVTDLTKVVGGIRSVVLYVTDADNGELVEAELAFRAQDDHGNVWHLGEHPEEYENGRFLRAPTWIGGLAGARAGIAMQALPKTKTPSYAEGYAPPPIHWADRAKVAKTGQSVCVPAGCYRHVLVMREFERSKPKAAQLKLYAPRVGLVKVSWTGTKENEQEVLSLVKVSKLTKRQMNRVRAKALKLERHAYKVSAAVYGQTPPSVVRKSG